MRRLFYYSIALIFLLLLECSQNIASGGGGETTNGMVIGTLLTQNNEPASQTRVILIPDTSNPVTAGTVNAEDTTDINGNYLFSNVKPGTYNVQALHLVNRTSTLVMGIQVNDDTVTAPLDTVRDPGSVKITLTASLKVPNSYIYIPGTTLYTMIDTLDSVAILDSVPAVILPSVNHGVTTSPQHSIIRYRLPVKSKETVLVVMPSWQHSRRIYLNTSPSGAGVSENVYNFPVLIRLTSANFNFTEAKLQGEDIRFTKEDNTLLSHETEQWDPVAQKAAIWVKVDTVYGNSSDRFIVMYWANGNASDISSSTGVFDTTQGCAAVWHLNSNCLDATGNEHNGTNHGAADTAGIIGFSKKFSGNDSISIPGLCGTPSSITLSAWARLEQPADSGAEVVSIGNAVLLRMDDTRFNNTFGTMASFHANNTHYDFCCGQYHAKTGWHHLVFTINSNTFEQKFYVDGVLHDSGTVAFPVDYTGVGQNTVIGVHGHDKVNVYDFTGLIDEVRFYSIPHSAAYIKLCYMNQKENDALIQFEQSLLWDNPN